VQFAVTLENIGLLVEHIFKIIRENESCSFVLIARVIEFLLKIVVLLLQGFVLNLSLLKIALVLF
jgi:hypothetical protein